MNSSEEKIWRGEYTIETSASAAVVWGLLSYVDGWKNWNAGVERIEITGPFIAGTEFQMTTPGQERFTSRLVEVRPLELFIDETRIDNLVIRVSHRIENQGLNQTRVTYAVEAIGEGAAEIGPMVSADFPDVLRSLARAAETSESM